MRFVNLQLTWEPGKVRNPTPKFPEILKSKEPGLSRVTSQAYGQLDREPRGCVDLWIGGSTIEYENAIQAHNRGSLLAKGQLSVDPRP